MVAIAAADVHWFWLVSFAVVVAFIATPAEVGNPSYFLIA